MKIVVVGGGLAGISSAYFLSIRGFDVTLVDRRPGPALETSFANGGLLTPSMPEPWNSPGCWRTLLASVGQSDAPMQLHLGAVPSLASWGLTFLRNSTPERYQRNLLTNLRLAQYSLQTMFEVRANTGIEYGRSARGTLRIFRNQHALDAATAAARGLAEHGLNFRRLTPQETVNLEPALQPIGERLSGALYYEGDETGDAHRFCRRLEEYLRGRGVHFQYGCEITSIRTRAGRVTELKANGLRLAADLYIVAAGSYCRRLLWRAGLRIPVQPVKGYSVTFEDPRTGGHLGIPVIDDHLHAGVVPLAGAVRVVGTAEFARFDLRIREERVRNLLTLLKEVLPGHQLDVNSGSSWCGLRPMSADGVPIIGGTALSNLMLNTGHGHLGWTMAAGSARLLADLITNQTPGLDACPFSIARFD
jgi:D-amino-acid dehydrogenase